jgi:hypothetical protein
VSRYPELTRLDVEVLAAAIHETWCALGKEEGWSTQPFSDKPYAVLALGRDAHESHPDLLPYAKLLEREKGKDRNSIHHYPDFAARVGYRIVLIG